MAKHKYQVVVGNVGTMDYTSRKLAKDCYTTYVAISKNGKGRTANEPVTLLKDGEIIEEHTINKIMAMFNIEEIKKQITSCPKDQVVILRSNWSINKPSYDSDEDPEAADWDFTEFEDKIGFTLLVNDYDDLICDPHGIY